MGWCHHTNPQQQYSCPQLTSHFTSAFQLQAQTHCNKRKQLQGPKPVSLSMPSSSLSHHSPSLGPPPSLPLQYRKAFFNAFKVKQRTNGSRWWLDYPEAFFLMGPGDWKLQDLFLLPLLTDHAWESSSSSSRSCYSQTRVIFPRCQSLGTGRHIN